LTAFNYFKRNEFFHKNAASLPMHRFKRFQQRQSDELENFTSTACFGIILRGNQKSCAARRTHMRHQKLINIMRFA
jgi:hypothetical protein